jgi:cation diffusion facilitator family transporter
VSAASRPSTSRSAHAGARIGQPFEFPEEMRRLRAKARRLSWLSVVLLTSAAVAVFLTVGQSQAMKTAWITDLLTAIPPIALLVATRKELRAPTRRFPYGYTRAVAMAFLVTSGVLSIFGLYLFVDSVMKLVHGERPPIGTVVLFGHQLWAGWLMIAGLAWSLACGLLLGLLKVPVAEEMKDKALHAEATMNKDEWYSEAVAIAGILGVGYGFWWADAAVASLISLEIIHDGWMNVRLVLGDLMDESPTTLNGKELDDVVGRVRDAIEELDGVARAGVRLREHGRAITGELFVVLGDSALGDPAASVARVAERARAVDWRLHDLTVMPVAQLDAQDPPRVAG